MEHYIRAFIGTHSVIQELGDAFINTKEIKLPQGYGMIFLTDVLLDSMAELFESDGEPSDSAAVIHYLLLEYSFHTKLVYIEIRYSGGAAVQSGTLYENGRISLESCGGEEAINSLLRYLGVRCEANKNEFDSLNLGIYRRMDKWIK